MDIFLLLWHLVDTSANYLSKIESQGEFAINLNWFWQPTQRASLLQRLTIWQNATITYNEKQDRTIFIFVGNENKQCHPPQNKVQTLVCEIFHMSTAQWQSSSFTSLHLRKFYFSERETSHNQWLLNISPNQKFDSMEAWPKKQKAITFFGKHSKTT